MQIGSTYHDGDTGTSMSAWYGQQGVASGAGGLGSEFDYALTSSDTWSYFGHDWYEANY